jgi:hypothetical protein
VFAVRTPTPDFVVMPRELGELDQDASRGLLASLGVESSDLQSRLARLLHGNPLSLRLAAEILEADDSREWGDIENLTDDTAIQGILYGRILGHIHQDDVKKIAHPGLILRRITADLIRQVLAEPCGVRMDDPKYADTLFDLLRNELSLVTPEGDAVRRRADMRHLCWSRCESIAKTLFVISKKKRSYCTLPGVHRVKEIIIACRSVISWRRRSRWLPGVKTRPFCGGRLRPARAYLQTVRIELMGDWDAVDQKTGRLCRTTKRRPVAA